MTDADEVLEETRLLTDRMLATVRQLERFTAELNAEVTRIDSEREHEGGGSPSD